MRNPSLVDSTGFTVKVNGFFGHPVKIAFAVMLDFQRQQIERSSRCWIIVRYWVEHHNALNPILSVVYTGRMSKSMQSFENCKLPFAIIFINTTRAVKLFSKLKPQHNRPNTVWATRRNRSFSLRPPVNDFNLKRQIIVTIYRSTSGRQSVQSCGGGDNETLLKIFPPFVFPACHCVRFVRKRREVICN